jgi:hypothetical protein
LGKSTWLMAVAAQVTTGKLNGGQPASVIVVSYEDTIEEILRPRAEVANADLGRLFEIAVPADLAGVVLLPRDISRLEDQIEETAARLVIVDPVLAAIDLALDAHKGSAHAGRPRPARRPGRDAPLRDRARPPPEQAPAVDPYLRISSSSGFYNAARSVVVVVPDPEKPEGASAGRAGEVELVSPLAGGTARPSRDPVGHPRPGDGRADRHVTDGVCGVSGRNRPGHHPQFGPP